jgi:hypothetical protein
MLRAAQDLPLISSATAKATASANGASAANTVNARSRSRTIAASAATPAAKQGQRRVLLNAACSFEIDERGLLVCDPQAPDNASDSA